MTSGARAGTGGTARRWPDVAVCYAALIALTTLFNSVNVLSILHEHVRAGDPLEWWRPAVWEGTSGLAIVAVAALPMWMIARFPIGGLRSGAHLLLHLVASVAFSLAHVGLMIALRHVAYAFSGEPYVFAGGLNSLSYEYRKDLLSYLVIAALFWTVSRLRQAAPHAPELTRDGRGLIEIDEGQRLLRVPPSDVMCARSSGNYVEFFLADGRRPLMRTTLARVESELASAGFVRTHRSWLVNPDAVVEAAAEGSGDFGLKLADGTEVPLSRRFPEALGSIRSGTLRPAK